jgi:D-arabinonate dehydratase
MAIMKNLELIAVEVPLNKVFSGSGFRVDRRSTIVTRIETEDGLVSEIYNGDNRTDAKEIIKIITDRLWPAIKGENIDKSQMLWEKMFALIGNIKNRKNAMEALSCVDCAIWDLKGKSAGKNISSLIGGYHDELPLMGICGYYVDGKTLVDIEKDTEWIYNTNGTLAIKFKVGCLSPEEEARRVEAARKGAPNMVIAVDSNRGWDYNQAVCFANLVEKYDIRWFEEPFHWYDDSYGMSKIRNKISIPVTAGQCEITGHGVRRLLEERAVDIVNFDTSEGGGVTEWLRVAGMCRLYGVEMSHHEEPQVAMQMLASIPHSLYLENFPDPERDPVWFKMVSNRPPIIKGKVKVLTGPGFGIKLDWDYVKKYRVN